MVELKFQETLLQSMSACCDHVFAEKETALILLMDMNVAVNQDSAKVTHKCVKASDILCSVSLYTETWLISKVHKKVLLFTDIDECREGKCQNGRCTNTPGSFICDCPPGFDVSPDGTTCTDHDECKEIGMCTNGICINMDGSFKCQCKGGYKLSPSKYACIGMF